MAGKNKASKFEGMTDDQILAKAEALKREFENTPERKRPKDFYIFGNKAVEINKARRAARKKARMSKENTFDTGLTTTWRVPEGMEQTRNRLAALIMQESGPRADAAPEYTLLGERLVASALKNYMDKYGLTTPELISGKDKYGGPGYLTSIADIQERPERSVYDWANDKFKRDMFVHDDTTFTHMTNAVRLASALVNGTLRPLTTATNFKHLAPDDEFNGMTKVDYDFGTTPVPTTKVLKLYVDPNLKRTTRQDAKGGDTRRDVRAAKGAGDTEGPGVPTDAGRIQDRMEERGQATAQNYTNMSVHDKLKLADERLEKLKGTDKYDAFKKRVDAMKHKYGEIARIAPDAKWNYDEASQAGGQKGLPDLQPNVQIAGESIVPDYDSTLARRQTYLDWYSKRGWGSRFASKLIGQNKQLADTAKQAKDDIAYIKGMNNALGYAVANPERARALGALITPRQFLSDGSPWTENPSSFVWNENLGRFEYVPRGIKIKPREPAQGVRQDAKGGNASGPETSVSEAEKTSGVAKAVKKTTSALDVVGDGVLAYSVASQAMKNRIAASKVVPIKLGLAGQLATAGVSTAADQAADFVDTYRNLRATPSDVAQAVRATLGRPEGWRNIGRGLAAAVLDAGNYIIPGNPLPSGDRIRETMEDAKGGDAGQGPEVPVETSANAPAPQGGPRIVINPAVFKDKRDALCVAMNEAFRIVMEDTGFEPVSEPTEAQRRFFSDTAYADDELQMRRTILARICTFDTSVKDPTDEQLQESVEFLHSVLEAGYPQNEWEQALVQKLLDILSRVPTGRRGGTSEPEPSTGGGLETQGDVAGGIAGNVEREEERDLRAGGAVLENPKYDAQGVAAGPQQDADVLPTVEHQNENNLRAGGAVLADPRHDAEGAEFDAERRREQQGV